MWSGTRLATDDAVMRKLSTWFLRISAGGLVAAGLVAACHETPSTPVTPMPREAPPLGDRPEITPGVHEKSPTPQLSIPEQKSSDGGVQSPAQPGPLGEASGLRPQASALATLGAIPAAAAVDAGIDSPVDLPPEVPDAGTTVLPDAAK